jgi:hypothetical protein
MRVYAVTTARADWYDRNPIARANAYNATGIIPHAASTRWTYTVPAGKKFALQTAYASLMRDASATTLSYSRATVFYTPSGGSQVFIIATDNLDNTVGSIQSLSIGGTTTMLAGDAIRGETADLSTGGSMVYRINSQGLEFDA